MTLYKAGALPLVGQSKFVAIVETNGEPRVLKDKRGIRRAFNSQAAAMAAAEKEIHALVKADADVFKRRPLPVPHVAARLLAGVTMPKNPLTIWRQPRN